MMLQPSYFAYLLTNKNKTVLYAGVTNNLGSRLVEHYVGAINHKKSFTAKYNCYYLLWYEPFQYVNDAIGRENVIKNMSRKEKEVLISSINPEWKFLNVEFLPKWPPDEWMMKWMVRES